MYKISTAADLAPATSLILVIRAQTPVRLQKKIRNLPRWLSLPEVTGHKVNIQESTENITGFVEHNN